MSVFAGFYGNNTRVCMGFLHQLADTELFKFMCLLLKIALVHIILGCSIFEPFYFPYFIFGVDETFKSCPEIFAQVYIIMAWYMGECLPACFCLLGGKKESTYRRMLHELKLAALALSFEFRPNEIILDFEVGAISALKHEFPQSGLIGCFFLFWPIS